MRDFDPAQAGLSSLIFAAFCPSAVFADDFQPARFDLCGQPHENNFGMPDRIVPTALARPLLRRPINVLRSLQTIVLAAALVLVALIGGPATSAHAFTHPGIPLSRDDLDTLKANLGVEPWKTAYAALASDSKSKTTYVMQGPFASVSRTPDVNLNQYKNDMQAAYNLAFMWSFTAAPAYAQLSRDILIAWATTHTSMDGAEMYLAEGDYIGRTVGAADILRGS